MAGFTRLQNVTFAFDANGLLATVKPTIIIPLGAGDIEDQTTTVFDATMSLFGRLIEARRGTPINGFQIFIRWSVDYF